VSKIGSFGLFPFQNTFHPLGVKTRKFWNSMWNGAIVARGESNLLLDKILEGDSWKVGGETSF